MHYSLNLPAYHAQITMHTMNPNPLRRGFWLSLAAVLLTAAVLRAGLLAAGAFTFHSDEAIVGLMARHMLQGREFPIFFYGQAYMGSLDAICVAAGFALFGESVHTIRLVQAVLYLGVVASTFWLGWRLSGRRWVASLAGLMVAVPPAVLTLYTAVSLGGYNETLILGNLILVFSYEAAHTHADSRWRWALLGALAGLGWWVNGLIIIYWAPAALLMMRRFALRRVPRYLLAFVFAMVLSAPWWQYNFSHNNAAIEVFIGNPGGGFNVIPPAHRLIGLVFLGFPAVTGTRYPWEQGYFALPVAVVGGMFYAALRLWWIRQRRPVLRPDARGLLLGLLGLFCLVFVGSAFGADPTGRYFLPLAAPLAVLAAAALDDLRAARRTLAHGLAVGLLSFYLLGNAVAAVRRPPGFTPQFDPITHIPRGHDQELIDFLLANGLTRGYGSYWVVYRLAFLSGEKIVLSAGLPYDKTLSYNAGNERYLPYRETVRQTDAAHIAYITANHPRLDAIIRQKMQDAGAAFQEIQIGPYHIFYGFSEHLTPEALGLHNLDAGEIEVQAPSIAFVQIGRR